MLALVGLLFVLPFQAPTPTPPAPPLEVATPSDPKERMEAADKLNGLHGIDIPWHLKASYEVFADDGKSIDKGTYEQWWVNDQRYRIALHSPLVSVEEFGTDHGVFRTGQQEWPRHPLSSIAPIVARPVQPLLSEKMFFENYQKSFAAEKLPCTAVMTRSPEQTPNNAASFCFASTNAVLLYATTPNEGVQTLFQQIHSVHGHYLAYDIQQYLGHTKWLKVHIDLLEDLEKAGLSALALPADATPATGRLGAPASGLLSSPAHDDLLHAIKKIAPTYPAAAKMQGIQGAVVVSCIIGKDGHVTGMQGLSGPKELREAAFDAVSKWIYSPYLRDGKPVEVETEITVVFRLGR